MKCLMMLLFSPLAMAQTTHQHTLAIGESITIPAVPMESLRVQRKGIISIKDLGSQLLLTGKKMGQTSITSVQRKDFIQVISRSHYQSFKKLEKWLKGKRGPHIEILSQGPILRGRILTRNDLEQLSLIMAPDDRFLFSARLNETLRSQWQQNINLKLRNSGLIPGDWLEQPYWQMRLPPSEKKQLKIYKKILHPIGVTPFIDSNVLTQRKMIKVKMIIALVSRNFLRHIGLQWADQWTGIWPQGGAPQWQSLQLNLKTLEQNGQGQVVATPTLYTENNKTAEFHSGGEFPIRTTTQFNNNVQWKKYGLFLKTKPQMNGQKHLRVEVDIEMSSLDHSHSSQDVPALIRHQIKTQVNMKRAQPFLLSGFLRSSQQSGQEGLPWLSQIPLFKPLFSHGKNINSNLELIFLMIPEPHE